MHQSPTHSLVRHGGPFTYQIRSVLTLLVNVLEPITLVQSYTLWKNRKDISPLCVDINWKSKESTTRRYNNWHIESINNRVREVSKLLNDGYVFKKPARTEGGIKRLVYRNAVMNGKLRILPVSREERIYLTQYTWVIGVRVSLIRISLQAFGHYRVVVIIMIAPSIKKESF